MRTPKTLIVKLHADGRWWWYAINCRCHSGKLHNHRRPRYLSITSIIASARNDHDGITPHGWVAQAHRRPPVDVGLELTESFIQRTNTQ